MRVNFCVLDHCELLQNNTRGRVGAVETFKSLPIPCADRKCHCGAFLMEIFTVNCGGGGILNTVGSVLHEQIPHLYFFLGGGLTLSVHEYSR